MKAEMFRNNPIVTAVLLIFFSICPLHAQTADLDALFGELLTADAAESQKIEQEIWIEWSKSGSAAMDLLLDRGRAAMAAGDPEMAVQHLTALVDHAPDFAEGWNARATAYYQTGDFGPAISDIGHVLTLNPRHFGALAGLGAIFEELDQPEKAIEVYRAALAISPHGAGLQEAIDRLTAPDQAL
jgi:tetratricopeptide (TPR) repeat protein